MKFSAAIVILSALISLAVASPVTRAASEASLSQVFPYCQLT